MDKTTSKIVISTTEASFLAKRLLESIEEAKDHGMQYVFLNSYDDSSQLRITVKPTKEEYDKIIGV